MMEDIQRFAGVRLGPGTLYGAIHAAGTARVDSAAEVRAEVREGSAPALHPQRGWTAIPGSAAFRNESDRENRAEKAEARMKRLARRLVRLYPRRWRARYGQEFEALLEDADLGWRDLFDVLLEGVRMRMEQTKVEPRIVELSSRDIPHGYELESAVEYPREDGSKMLVRWFQREIDLGDSYVTLNHSMRGSQPAQTILVYGRKGKVDGDFRTDQKEMLVLRRTVKTCLKYDAIRDALRADEIHKQIQGSAKA